MSDCSSKLIRIAASRRHFAAQVNINKFLSSFVWETRRCQMPCQGAPQKICVNQVLCNFEEDVVWRTSYSSISWEQNLRKRLYWKQWHCHENKTLSLHPTNWVLIPLLIIHGWFPGAGCKNLVHYSLLSLVTSSSFFFPSHGFAKSSLCISQNCSPVIIFLVDPDTPLYSSISLA